MGWFGLSKQQQLYWQNLTAGDRVDITVREAVETIYQTRIESISAQSVSLRTPRIGSSVLELKPKAICELCVYKRNGLYRFKTYLIRHDWSDRAGLMEFAKPGVIVRVENRQHFRLNVVVPVQYGVLPTHVVDPDVAVNIPYFSVTKNISEGGVLIVVDNLVPDNALVKLKINLEMFGFVNAVGRILEQKKLDLEHKIALRLQFVKIATEDRETIRKFVFEKSRDLLHEK
jgi:c-di-GMP-binding flagellar brake protein YcgR